MVMLIPLKKTMYILLPVFLSFGQALARIFALTYNRKQNRWSEGCGL